ncbi:E3 ubiquitin-protein ligase RMA1H1-like [Diospyros lotus]|uniref:E3 ubiquitin-protein ligase RMA1H1-like n=1 Tax=Diospyros lotus TaxID=55363 RepID=UPI002255CFDB|nr:E3 ubiquitin-protein ligase RMA1H1-like [Diospyros lotus]XP_052202867.1 E3 ubiquitin-protein ligase RMA1H1-like [Diospyros lotus]
MACEDYFANEWKSIPTAARESENLSGGFDCNICLDFACDPVVTLCGHLYCWPCLYKWLHSQSTCLSSDQQPKCPVCKADISHTMVVPLYGRGHSPNQAELEDKAPSLGVAIPPRPPACGTQAPRMSASQCVQQLRYRNPYQNQQYPTQPYGSHMEDTSPPPLFSPSGSTASVGMFGEMVYARVFGNSESLYAYPNSYHLSGSSSPRLRRQEMQADKSLNRISIFLFCCVLLCLLLF